MENTQAPQEEIKLGPVCKFFKKYTLDGEVLIEQNQETGEYREYPLKTEDLLPLPPAFKVSHTSQIPEVNIRSNPAILPFFPGYPLR